MINSNQILGIDVSHFQGSIPWKQVLTQNNVRFAIVKATEGSTYTDSQFSQNWESMYTCKDTLLVRGTYMFFHYYADKNIAKAQVDHYIHTVQEATTDIEFLVDALFVIDFEQHILEEDRADCIDQLFYTIKEIYTQLENITGTVPRVMIYTTFGFWNELWLNTSPEAYVQTIFSTELWLAYWPTFDFDPATYNPLEKRSIVGWHDWRIWQYSDRSNLMGIQGFVDRDIMNLD